MCSAVQDEDHISNTPYLLTPNQLPATQLTKRGKIPTVTQSTRHQFSSSLIVPSERCTRNSTNLRLAAARGDARLLALYWQLVSIALATAQAQSACCFSDRGHLIGRHLFERGTGSRAALGLRFLVGRCVEGDEEEEVRGEDADACHGGEFLACAFAAVGHPGPVGGGEVGVGGEVDEAYVYDQFVSLPFQHALETHQDQGRIG